MLHRAFQFAFSGTRLIDWLTLIVELLFIGTVLLLDLPERFHRRRVRLAVEDIKVLIQSGQKLVLQGPPTETATEESCQKRNDAVAVWIGSAHKSLANHSDTAAISFEQRRLQPDIHFRRISNFARASAWYQELLHRLTNLQNIMEKADVYF
jgi:hypothetical protein